MIRRSSRAFLLLAFWCGTGPSYAAAPADAALLTAVEKGDLATERTLLKRGANPDARRQEGNDLTALMIAARQGNSRAVRLLLDAGAHPNLTASVASGANGVNQGVTALMQAAASGDLPTVQLLLAKGADVNASARFAATGGTQADSAQTGRPVAFQAANTAILSALLKAGANPKAADPEGNTLLMHAAQYLDASAVCALLAQGADPDVRNAKGQTALDLARAASNRSADALATAPRASAACAGSAH